MFVDKVLVSIRAGRGGNGAVSFRHEKYIDHGGPDGGDGGDGGDVIVEGSDRENTLANFRFKKEIFAKDGNPGSKRKKHGRSAPDLIVPVPVGTVVVDAEGETLADITSAGQQVVIAKGGKGGFGNAHFVSSRRQAPRVAEKGEPGDEFEATFELKLIAEVGLVGLPNAGKSTLLSRISNAKPEIANYPFTTIKPNLGVVDAVGRSVLVADIPGLIEGASEGKGLGDEFLRHVERTKLLVHLIDAYTEDLESTYRVIRNELAAYRVDLSKRPEIVVLTKIEGLDEEIIEQQISVLKKAVKRGTPILAISSQSGEGLDALKKTIGDYAARQEQKAQAEVAEALPVIRLMDLEDSWNVTKVGDDFVVSGSKIERFAKRTDFDNFAGVDRLRDIMRKMGIMHELERKKIEPGQQIIIGKKQEYGRLEY